MSTNLDRILREPEVQRTTGLSRTTRWRGVKAGTFSQTCPAHTHYDRMVPNGFGSQSRGRRFARTRTVPRIIPAGPAPTGTGRAFGGSRTPSK